MFVSKKIDVYHTGKLAVISTFINDENGDRIKCTWFNMPFLKSSLKLGNALYIQRQGLL